MTTKDQLPDIPGDGQLELTWDFVGHDDYKHETIIRNGEQVLFFEPASWESIDNRYEDICRILKEKYGERLIDVVPTDNSYLYLYGDQSLELKPYTFYRDRGFRAAKGDTQ